MRRTRSRPAGTSSVALQRGKYPFLLALTVPGAVIYGYFMFSPYLQAMWISLTDWGGYTATMNFVGLDNFRRMIADPQLLTALRNNLILLLVVPVLTLALGLFLASMINVGGRGRAGAVTGVRGSSVYKVVYFFPQVVSVVIVAVVWKYVFAPANAGGVLNNALEAIGLGRLAQLWLAEPKYLIWVVVIVMTWSFAGFYVVMFSAAMQSIPRDIYEAALLDGSSRFTTFRKITVPLVWDTVQVGWVYLAIQAMDGFALVSVMLGTGGGVEGAGDVLGVKVYREAFTPPNNFGYAAAIGVVLLLLTLAVSLIFMRILRRERVELA
ncbi:sugar ABC transporter permease [Phytoactinopolyspora alkaliphila]|uniref:Sugar ABC transporter permease n=1 Tax=Phytoactinopolyspora alkaliphila TaxID=1783498 RepID=A0A6N9YSD6_9ACTN|nr:sugar ABC transporter permease [Phytoactinopolyspora alkaliphila]NED97847.1 sugar ABC transporter permease [Phytoactinopolyspora alkaliphila]